MRYALSALVAALALAGSVGAGAAAAGTSSGFAGSTAAQEEARALAPPLTAAQTAAWAQARQEWVTYGARMLSYFRNGQCTDLVARLRPDVVERIYEAAWATSTLLGIPQFAPSFIARDWAAEAKLAGMTVSARPVVGALVVWQPGVQNAGAPDGHIGYVTRAGAGSFQTREENVGSPYHYGYGIYLSAPVAGRLFILP